MASNMTQLQKNRWAHFWAGVALLLGLAGCSGSKNTVDLQGSGATFPAPLYKRWFLEYYENQGSTRVNYSPIGSGAGIRQFTAGLVNFGASDAGISKKEIAKLPPEYGGVLALPMTAGCIVLAYNLSGMTQPVRLSRDAYIRIFLHDIKNWNDEAIAKTNPGVSLPDQKITVVTRADSSGTTYAFTSHMDAVAKASGLDWTPGVDKSVKFPKSISAQGNDGVSALIQLTPGAIGYVEYGYAKLSDLPMAALENRAHRFVVPSDDGETGRKALEDAPIPEDLQIKVPDPENAEAYPIVTYTWVLARKHYEDARDASAVKSLLAHCLEEPQQKVAAELGYISLPARVVDRIRGAIAQITP
jgi:phosphate transport system substrate-binding protein